MRPFIVYIFISAYVKVLIAMYKHINKVKAGQAASLSCTYNVIMFLITYCL